MAEEKWLRITRKAVGQSWLVTEEPSGKRLIRLDSRMSAEEVAKWVGKTYPTMRHRMKSTEIGF